MHDHSAANDSAANRLGQQCPSLHRFDLILKNLCSVSYHAGILLRSLAFRLNFCMLAKMEEIKIIGGGLAGLSLAIGLRRMGVPVVVKEAGHYPRHRVCGEFISGLRDSTIDGLGLGPALRDAVSLEQTRWYDGRRRLREDRLPVAARGLSRWMLDEGLAAELTRLGGTIETGVRCDRRVPGEGVVDCAGRQAAKDRRWVGLKCHVEGFQLESDLEMHMSAGGYVGLSRIEDGRVNVCGLFRNAGLKPGGDQPFVYAYLGHCGFGRLLERLQAASPVEGSACSVAALGYGPPVSAPGSLALGDARGLIPPFTGNGMTLAFESAALAVEPLRAFAEGEQSWTDCTAHFASAASARFGRRLAVARWMHRCLVSQRWFPLTAVAARTPLFPFQSLFRLTR